MVIVSQNGNETMNFEKAFNTWISFEDGFEIYADGEDLGRYETDERAREILQEIIEARAFFEEIKIVEDTIERRKKLETMKYRYFDTYEMPKE